MPTIEATPINLSAFKQKVGFFQIFRQSFRGAKFISVFIFLSLAILFSSILLATSLFSEHKPQSPGFWVITASILWLSLIYLAVKCVDRFMGIRQTIYLKQFTKDNNFTFMAEDKNTAGYEGVIFDYGTSRHFRNVVKGQYQKLPFEFANYSFTAGSGKHRHKYTWGMLRVTLSRRLPHALLDATSNSSFVNNNVLRIYKNKQKLQLEGNFNKYFDLYVPEGYQRDVLYFMTPELMQLLIDYGAEFDVEMIDNYLFIYSNKPFSLDKAATIMALFNLINVVGSEVQENVQRYSDARVGNRQANIVDTPGRRLKTKSGLILTIIVVLIYAIFVVIGAVDQ